MNKHLNQCSLNEEFLAEIRAKFPDKFNDWKTTVTFYAATHHIRGYALMQGVTIGSSHTDVHDYIAKNIAGGDKSEAFKAFRILYRNSRDVRYSGFTTRDNFERFCKYKLEESKEAYLKIRRNFVIETIEPAEV